MTETAILPTAPSPMRFQRSADLDRVLEVRTVNSDNEANEMLAGNWVLLVVETGIFTLGRVPSGALPYRAERPRST